MAAIGFLTQRIAAPPVQALSPAISRLVLGAALACAAVAGFVATGDAASTQAVAQAGTELTHLLRAMALLKTTMVAGAALAVFWRAGAGMTAAWCAAYALALASMAAGPGLIWDMAHVRTGAALLHGGLFATVLLLWRDRAVGPLLAAKVAARRHALAHR